jgi:hypothetical protein
LLTIIVSLFFLKNLFVFNTIEFFSIFCGDKLLAIVYIVSAFLTGFVLGEANSVNAGGEYRIKNHSGAFFAW